MHTLPANGGASVAPTLCHRLHLDRGHGVFGSGRVRAVDRLHQILNVLLEEALGAWRRKRPRRLVGHSRHSNAHVHVVA